VEVFARKVIRAGPNSAFESVEDGIKNEVRVISKLGAAGGHGNVVNTFNHGWLDDDQYYFDMEICILNLDDYICGDLKSNYGISNFADPKSMERELGCLSFVGIIQQITSGLEFLHSIGELHRDLKPRNGMFRSLLHT
jgi:serine/threonine protein kinase